MLDTIFAKVAKFGEINLYHCALVYDMRLIFYDNNIALNTHRSCIATQAFTLYKDCLIYSALKQAKQLSEFHATLFITCEFVGEISQPSHPLLPLRGQT